MGIARNPVLEALTEELSAAAKTAFEATGQSQRRYGETRYAAKTWSCQRRVIHKAEYNALGENNRYVVTNLEGGAEGLYKDVYCARGDMENRIKEQQLD
ncbi:MAG: transposase, partial [Kiritimatiellaeota bacterium]|nr:transposase [Kiritimatiellota bacterium]